MVTHVGFEINVSTQSALRACSLLHPSSVVPLPVYPASPMKRKLTVLSRVEAAYARRLVVLILTGHDEHVLRAVSVHRSGQVERDEVQPELAHVRVPLRHAHFAHRLAVVGAGKTGVPHVRGPLRARFTAGHLDCKIYSTRQTLEKRYFLQSCKEASQLCLDTTSNI